MAMEPFLEPLIETLLPEPKDPKLEELQVGREDQSSHYVRHVLVPQQEAQAHDDRADDR